jgi:Family of unknown function (DUF5939)
MPEERRIWRKKESLLPHMARLPIMFIRRGPSRSRSKRNAVETAPDRTLCRINPLAFAASHELGEEPVISTLVYAARLGLFDMAWNVLCPGCGGVDFR